jgi:hypothetical protein
MPVRRDPARTGGVSGDHDQTGPFADGDIDAGRPPERFDDGPGGDPAPSDAIPTGPRTQHASPR